MLGLQLKHLVGLALSIAITGCAQFVPRDITRAPVDAYSFSAIYFTSPNGSRVRVFEISARGNGLSVTDYGLVPEPVYLLPGKTRVTFACPDAKVYTYDNEAVVYTPRPGSYYLRCNSEGQLNVALRNGAKLPSWPQRP